jgi:nucleotide-binding universal stress UspA family protein
MFATIVAGCDGHERGRAAVSFASILAQVTGARLVVAAAYLESSFPYPPGLLHAHAEDVERALDAVRDELAPDATTVTFEAHSPARALRQLAEREGADLVVVGSRHRAALQRLVDVDHSMQVLHDSPRPVVVVPDDADVRPRLERIAVGVDGSPESLGALAVAVELARCADARLWLQVIVDGRPPAWSTSAAGYAAPVDWSAWQDGTRRLAQEALQRALASIDEDVAAGGNIAVGHPARDLAGVGTWSDLLVLGSRHWGPLGRLVLGSTSEAVVRRASRPVLVVPRGAVGATVPSSNGVARAQAAS